MGYGTQRRHSMKNLNSYVIDIINEYKLDIQLVGTNQYWSFKTYDSENIDLLKAIGTVGGFTVRAVLGIHPKKQFYYIHVDRV